MAFYKNTIPSYANKDAREAVQETGRKINSRIKREKANKTRAAARNMTEQRGALGGFNTGH